MKETKEAVLTLFKVISKSMIDRSPTMGAEYAWKAEVKGKEPVLFQKIGINYFLMTSW